MIENRGNKRVVSICLKDFSYDVELVRSLLGDHRVEFVKTGDQIGKISIARKNFVSVWEPMYALENWDLPIFRLIEKLGGIERIRQLLGLLNAKRAWLQLDLPIMGSPYVESNRVSGSLMQNITSVGLNFGIEVFMFDSDEPTHHPAADVKG